MKALLKIIFLFSIIAGGSVYGLAYSITNTSTVNNGGFFLSRWDPSGALAYSTCAASQADLTLDKDFTPLNTYNVTYVSDSTVCSNIKPGDLVPSESTYLSVNLFTVSYQHAASNRKGVLEVDAAYISPDVTFSPGLQILCKDHIDLFAQYIDGYKGIIQPEDQGECNIYIISNN